MLCSLFIAKGDYKQAEHDAVESYQIRKMFGHRLGIAYSLLNLGQIADAQQQYTMDSQHFKDALAIGEEINDPHVKGVSLRELGRLAHLAQDLHRSRHLFLESVLIFQTAGRQPDAAITQQEMESLNQH